MLSRLRLVGAHFSLRPPPSRLTLGMVTPYCLGTRHFYSSPQPWRKIVHDQADLPFKQVGIAIVFYRNLVGENVLYAPPSLMMRENGGCSVIKVVCYQYDNTM